jgi:hypothetical protein
LEASIYRLGNRVAIVRFFPGVYASFNGRVFLKLQNQFDSAFEALMGKAQDVMNVVKAILKDAQGGSLPDLQLQITQAIEELQRVCAVRNKIMPTQITGLCRQVGSNPETRTPLW